MFGTGVASALVGGEKRGVVGWLGGWLVGWLFGGMIYLGLVGERVFVIGVFADGGDAGSSGGRCWIGDGEGGRRVPYVGNERWAASRLLFPAKMDRTSLKMHQDRAAVCRQHRWSLERVPGRCDGARYTVRDRGVPGTAGCPHRICCVRDKRRGCAADLQSTALLPVPEWTWWGAKLR